MSSIYAFARNKAKNFGFGQVCFKKRVYCKVFITNNNIWSQTKKLNGTLT